MDTPKLGPLLVGTAYGASHTNQSLASWEWALTNLGQEVLNLGLEVDGWMGAHQHQQAEVAGEA